MIGLLLREWKKSSNKCDKYAQVKENKQKRDGVKWNFWR